MTGQPPRIQVISCRFGWGYRGDKEVIAAAIPEWEQVVCCGSIEPERLLEPLAKGIDGILLFACPRGECHFQEGEWHCLKRLELLRELLAAHGIAPQRLAVHCGNDPEGESMAGIVRDFAQRLKEP